MIIMNINHNINFNLLILFINFGLIILNHILIIFNTNFT